MKLRRVPVPALALASLALGAFTLAGSAYASALTPSAQAHPAETPNADTSSTNSAAGPVIQAEFSNPELTPSHWTLILHPDGTGHFSSRTGDPQDGLKEMEVPDIDRDVQLSAGFASHVFEEAEHHNWFNLDCESHLKVAFQGWKTLAYRGPDGNGSCKFNFSKDKDIQSLGDSLEAVAETILEGQRLEMLLEHDRLGLDKEMEFLVDAAGNGRAQQICTIRGILSRLADDDEVMERVRKRARMLLAQADT